MQDWLRIYSTIANASMLIVDIRKHKLMGNILKIYIKKKLINIQGANRNGINF